MDRFLSSFVNRIDAKGRVSIPAQFRALLRERGTEDIYALRALEEPAMNMGGKDYLDRSEERIAREDPFLETADDMSLFYYGDGTMLKLDGDGRITMTDFIREHTGIGGDVCFVGRGHYFQMWEPSRFEAQRAEARARLLKVRRSAVFAGGESG
jgi:MraZ protein